jgi:prophage regulatory protein
MPKHMRIHGQCDLFCIRKRGEQGPTCKKCGRFPRGIYERPHLHWIGPSADGIDRKLIARLRRDRIYASAIAGSKTRMNRLASTTRSAAEPARLFARLPAVIEATGLGRSTIYRLVANGAFPRPVHLGPRAIAWRWSDLEQWSATRAADHH